MKEFFVYIMASESGTLYIGVTNNIRRRVYEHKNHLKVGFTDVYNVEKLVYVESFLDSLSALRREKQLKGWRREKKIGLIDSINVGWNDLSDGWYDDS